MTVSLNGFSLTFSSPTFTVFEQDLPEPKDVKSLRERLASEWFLRWHGGKLYGIPRVEQPQTTLGKQVTLTVTDHNSLHILTDRLNDILPSVFPKYNTFRRRPFAFLGQKDEVVDKVISKWKDVPALVPFFKIQPKFELDPRIIEITDGEVAVGLFMAVHTRWQIFAPLDELVAAGIDLHGLHVVRRRTNPGEKRLVGRIGSISSREVMLEESFDNLSSIALDQVWLEGRRESFKRCLTVLLGHRFQDFERQRTDVEASFLTGPAIDRLLAQMEGVLKKASPIRLTSDLSCSVIERVHIANTGQHQALISLKAVEYCFDAAKSKRNALPWTGLERYGPYSQDSFSKRTPRILVVCPDNQVGRIQQSMKLFRDGITSLSRSAYANGFARTLHLVNPEFKTLPIPINGRNGVSSDSYRKALEDHLAREIGYDAAIVVPPGGRNSFNPQNDPYLHAKAILLLNGIPVQEALPTTLSKNDQDLQYVFRNIAVSLYAKMGGVPWTVDHDLTVDDEIVIGLGTAELSGSRFEERQRHIGITTVFRGDGNYLLSNLSRECSYKDYPEVLERSTLEVLEEIKGRNGWRAGDAIRVVFHAFKPFKNIEVSRIVAKCLRQVGASQEVKFAFLTVYLDHPFKIVDTSSTGRSIGNNQFKGRFAPERGVMVQLGRYTRLLCANGPSLMKRATTPLPSPLLVHLHRDSTYVDLTYLTEQVLKFTALSWRSVDPAQKPVTIYYSELIADLLGRLKSVPGWSPAVLNSKLRTSKWFL